MAYFTTLLQRQVNDVWKKKIEKADAEMRLHTSGKEIRDYLNNKESLNTAGFVIRRYLNKEYHDLLTAINEKTGLQFTDLSENLNIKWPNEFNQELAKMLHKLSKTQGISISKTTWMSYLDDTPAKMYKDTPFKVAFSLSMGIEETEELLMACGQDTYCFRNPDHFIYYYCQSLPRDNNWQRAQNLISRYKNASQGRFTANEASVGMTYILQNNLKKIFQYQSSNTSSDDELLQYMITHQKEFSGLSLTARSDFLRMAQYLAVLYPSFTKVVSSKDSRSGEITESIEEIPVSLSSDGTPKLSELVRALFSTGGWLSTTVSNYSSDDNGKKYRTASSIRRREGEANIEFRRAKINEQEDRPFLNSVQYFVDSYAHHLDAIDRVYRRPANPDNVERRDVILFTYFFIRRYPELLLDEETFGNELDKLTSLVYEDNRIDPCMDYLMEELYNITLKEESEKASGQYDEGADTRDYLQLFNEVLQRFGMKEMYMPNPWDRFITMSLFAKDPDFFTEAVLWNTIAEDDDMIEDSSFAYKLAEEDDYNNRSIHKAQKEDTKPSEMTEVLKKPLTPIPVQVNYPPALPYVIDSDGNKVILAPILFRKSTGDYITINKCSFSIGRHSIQSGDSFQDYGFQTENKQISRCHAVILFSQGNFYLADVSNRNETWLNNDHLENNSIKLRPMDPVFARKAYLLKSDDIIRLGDEEFIFSLSPKLNV